LFLARTLMLENKQDGAIATLRTGLKFKPGITVARRDLAAALFFTGRCREAETELETGPAHDATEPDLHCPPAMGAAMQGQYLRAGRQCAEALRLAPDFPSVPVKLAEILAAQRKAAGAISGYRRALKLQPDLPDA
jgi:Flp pilus assembly protein TadD